MYRVYFTALNSEFALLLAKQFEEHGFEITTAPVGDIEFFIDTTDAHIMGDDKALGEGLSQAALVEAYTKNVCEPLDKLKKILPYLGGRKRICFLSSKASSINLSEETTEFGHNMSKAALHQILTIAKNGMCEDGFTFRLFDPLLSEVPADKSAAVAFAYFTRDRYIDNDDDKSRWDERQLLLRDAKGREIPW